MFIRLERPAAGHGCCDCGVRRTTSSLDLDSTSGREPSISAPLPATNRSGFDRRTANPDVAHRSAVRPGTVTGR